MSTNLSKRFYNYLNRKRLENDLDSRINRALISYGFDNFSVTILEFIETPKTKGSKTLTQTLRNREDFFIAILKPQYNLKRNLVTRTIHHGSRISRFLTVIPHRVISLLKKCLDPAYLDYHLVIFVARNNKRHLWFKAITPNYTIVADSTGWFEGKITKPEGFATTKSNNKKLTTETIISIYLNKNVDIPCLAQLFTCELNSTKHITECLNKKLKTFKIRANNKTKPVKALEKNNNLKKKEDTNKK